MEIGNYVRLKGSRKKMGWIRAEMEGIGKGQYLVAGPSSIFMAPPERLIALDEGEEVATKPRRAKRKIRRQ